MLTWALALVLANMLKVAQKLPQGANVTTDIGCLFLLSIPCDVIIVGIICYTAYRIFL